MNKIQLYHYSNIDIKDKLKTSFFGNNLYTNHSKNLSKIKRIYFYIDKDKKEWRFNGCQYCYNCEINKIKLYNLISDKLNLLKKYNNNLNGILKDIKKRGYIGIIGNNGYNVAILLKDIKIKDKKINKLK